MPIPTNHYKTMKEEIPEYYKGKNGYMAKDVVSNFDLTFCEIWFDGKDVYANYKDDVLQKRGLLKDDYLELLFIDNNKFTKNRIEKYKNRGFEIYISKKNKPKKNIYSVNP